MIQSSRRGYQPYGKGEWIAAIKKIHKHGGSVFAGDLQDKHPYLYNQGVWIFCDWDKALRAAGIDPELGWIPQPLGQGKNHQRATPDAKAEFTALC
jgi:hypothetical protein